LLIAENSADVVKSSARVSKKLTELNLENLDENKPLETQEDLKLEQKD